MARASFAKLIRPAVVLTLALIVITGGLYPAVVTGAARALFPAQADGSLIERDGKVVGSALIGQSFTDSGYFHGRPSAAGAGYDATASAGTNKGPTDRKLADTLIAGAVANAVEQDGAVKGAVPADYATASASGLDPDISPATALVQVARVARVRHASPDAIRDFVQQHITARQFGVLGEPRVNVLALNLDLDTKFPRNAGGVQK
jgi:K+-transporting ATPase ATPase C chain